ncbi:hypothetical protein [Amycolatopsis kentuckyensis]|uniref:hypothetical protein n=1 Tax=Amycolatopsis kentuckyensis TaxID=218823 RepID=UPI00356A7DCC
MSTFTAPPRLAVGSHPGSTTYLCAMNVISWENGDREITDFPACTPRPLARMVQMVNDTYCRHITQELDPDTERKVSVLCASCSMKMLNLAHRTVHLPSPSQAGGWGWIADMLKADLRDAYVPAQVEILSQALRVAEARSAGQTPDCPTPAPRMAVGAGMTEVARSIVASERAMRPRNAHVRPVETWVPAGLGEELVTFMPPSAHDVMMQLVAKMKVKPSPFPPGVTPGAHYLPEMHYVRPPRDIMHIAGAHFVAEIDSRKTKLARAHEAIDMWTRNAVRATAPGIIRLEKESVAA